MTKREAGEFLRQVRAYCRGASEAVRQGDWEDFALQVESMAGLAALMQDDLEREAGLYD